MSKKKKAREIWRCSRCKWRQDRHPMFQPRCIKCGCENIEAVMEDGTIEYYTHNPYALPRKVKAVKPLDGQLKLFDNTQDATEM
jgi:hypothetical protein